MKEPLIWFFRRKLVDKTIPEILSDHLYADTYVNLPITPELSNQIASAIAKLDIAPSRIDIGKLAKEWLEEGANYASLEEFISKKLVNHIGQDKLHLTPKDVVLFGFGRIGSIGSENVARRNGLTIASQSHCHQNEK